MLPIILGKRFISIILVLISNFYINLSESSANFDKLQTCLINGGIGSSSIVKYSSNQQGEYATLNYQWNLLGGGHKTPMGYLLVKDTSHVQTAVKCAKSLNIRIVPKGGGHAYEKYSFGNNDTFVIDLQLLDQITIDMSTKVVEVGAGVLTGPLYWKVYNDFGLTLPLGTCPTVGISGLALGGGYGYISRLYGLASDNIQSLQMVDATGSLLQISNTINPDLFWALRGSGGGSFGIVTKFQIQAHSLPQTIVFGTKIYELIKFPTVFDRWQRSLASTSVPKEISTKLAITQRQIVLDVFEIQEQQNPTARDAVKNILCTFPKTIRNRTTINSLTYSEFLFKFSHPEDYGIKNIAQLQDLTRHSFPQQYFKSKSFFVDHTISIIDVWKIFWLIETIPKNVIIEIYPFSGAISEKSPTETAFVHRRNPATNNNNPYYLVQVFYKDFASSNQDGILEIQQSLNWVRSFYETMETLVRHNESYQNYIDDDLDNSDYLARYYGVNLKRLIKIKRARDPDNFFHHPQSIPVK